MLDKYLIVFCCKGYEGELKLGIKLDFFGGMELFVR